MIWTVLRAALVVVVGAAIFFLAVVYDTPDNTALAEYYIVNFTADTGAENAVAAIYLNYRVYDTLFEALLLLVAIVGIMHFFRIGARHD